MSAYDTLIYEVADNGVATIALNQPDTRNALSPQVLTELAVALDRARDDDAVRVVVLASTHARVFSSGGNLASFVADTAAPARAEQNALFPQVFVRLAELGKPSICAAGGHVLAGAVGLMLACDLVIARASARFGTPEINVGLFPFMVTALLYRNVPRKKVAELVLLGEQISATDAERIGLVNRVVPDAEFDAAVADWAARLAGKSPLMLRLGKQAMFEQQELSFSAALVQLQAQLTFAQGTDDAHEGIAAFFEKREPRWKGC
ncbi:MAG: enoyl-CoA hydratase/isomerase family protein [Acidobacteriota bacterium]|nr:enoyl-CoA hydratase/isomerase family protein [Acidobacteriota bacterium]